MWEEKISAEQIRTSLERVKAFIAEGEGRDDLNIRPHLCDAIECVVYYFPHNVSTPLVLDLLKLNLQSYALEGVMNACSHLLDADYTNATLRNAAETFCKRKDLDSQQKWLVQNYEFL